MKICCKCNKEINEKEDRWVNLRDFDKGEVVGDKDMHLQCWKEFFNKKIKNVLQEKVKQVVGMIQR